MILRRPIALALIAASIAACDGTDWRESTDPHPPGSADERLLANRYREFVGALERRDARDICRHLASRLAESYGCGKGALRLPRELRRITVLEDEVFAVVDPLVPREIQIAARTTREDGYSLIAFFRLGDDRIWRIARLMIGAYG